MARLFAIETQKVTTLSSLSLGCVIFCWLKIKSFAFLFPSLFSLEFEVLCSIEHAQIFHEIRKKIKQWNKLLFFLYLREFLKFSSRTFISENLFHSSDFFLRIHLCVRAFISLCIICLKFSFSLSQFNENDQASILQFFFDKILSLFSLFFFLFETFLGATTILVTSSP